MIDDINQTDRQIPRITLRFGTMYPLNHYV